MEIRPIATFISPFKEKFGIPRQSGVASTRGSIRLMEPYSNPLSLKGLEGFSHIWLIWGFSANRPAAEGSDFQPLVRPPRLGGNEHMGVFATRSPYRPNPIGLSSVQIEGIDAEKGLIHVLGADLLDGTPIYDIKPYVAYTDSHPSASGGFTDSRAWQGIAVEIPENVKAEIVAQRGEAWLQTIVEVLSQDPRPKYHNDPDRIYGLNYDGLDIHFKCGEKCLRVLDMSACISKGK